ncbi:MAG: hypothetical protein LBV49_00030 [Azonexus sp.]|jgi:hypothetical protein|nr:hypothetical protein [Azonexus sp.]
MRNHIRNRTRICAALFAATAAFGLSGCVADGYGGIGIGYGGGYYGGGYFGWYDDFYYPGSGYYVYDRHGARHPWNDGQRRYWEGRRGQGGGGSENWSGFKGGGEAGQQRDAWRAQQGGKGGGQGYGGGGGHGGGGKGQGGGHGGGQGQGGGGSHGGGGKQHHRD